MSRMNRSDRSELEALKKLCASRLGLEELAQRLAPRVAEHLEADSYCLYLLDPATSLPFGAVGQGCDLEAAHRAFVERFLAAASKAEEVVAPPSVPRPEEVPHRLEHSFEKPERPFARLTLERPPEAPAFEPRHHRFLGALAPHATDALRRAAAAALLEAAPGDLSGLVTLDPRGNVEAATPPFDALLDPATDDGPPLAVTVMMELVRQTLARDGDSRLPTVSFVDEATAARYRVHGELLRGRDGRRRGAVRLEPLRSLDDRATLQQLGLTRREAEVAELILRGFATEEAAEVLSLSAHTVEHHLRAVYDKLDVRTRTELAALLFGC